MLFNSFAFFIFLPIFFAAWFLTRGRAQLAVGAIGSYVFYGFWDWRYTGLLFLSTFVDFHLARAIAQREDEGVRRRLLVAGLVVNLGVLAIFKYYDFFVGSAQAALEGAGMHVSLPLLHVMVPVGISFYTFHSLSYTIDVYRREMPPEPSFLRYTVFVALFPHLVAGPIVRAHDVLPQLRRSHVWSTERWNSGMCLVLWGFYKKIVVADTLAEVVDHRFAHPEIHGSLSLAIGVVAYAFQIYADFSGYSDIAIGVARILGIDFPINFLRPYFAEDFSDFWRRWHISLSTWLRDYLYIPLGGNRGGTFKMYRNLVLTMLLGGFWHGANWTFVVWGALHGFYLVLQRLLAGPWRRIATLLALPPAFERPLLMAVTFSGTCLAWVFFRAQNVGEAWSFLSRLFTSGDWSIASVPQKFVVGKALAVLASLLLCDAAVEWFGASLTMTKRPALRFAMFAVAIWSIAILGTFHGSHFIYFQF
jgi:alginate O-acetyltransferase complex protein AlgI